MARYIYPYQKIVDLKKSEKTQAEWLLSESLGKLKHVEQSLGELLQERQQWRERLLGESTQVIALVQLQQMQAYVDYLDGLIAQAYTKVEEARGEVERSQAGLADKMQAEKLWLKAKEQSQGRFMQQLQAQEQNELDEIATARYMITAR